jgi:glyoxylase-like metal-dependent hydrolase (beta-lactamase superfamily II)
MITVCHPSAAVKRAQVLRSALVCCAVKPARLPLAALVAVLATACATQTLPVEKLEPVRVAADVYALLGSGGEITADNGGRTANVAFIVGPRGVVVVNTGISYAQGEAIIAAVQSVSNRPILLAILTHPGQEAIFGAAAFQARGIPVLAQRSGAELIAARCATCLRNLRATLGEEAMAGTRVVLPDRLIVGDERLDLIGRPLRLIAPPWSSAPGALAVFDEMTATLIAGSLVSIKRIPDLRDAQPKAWRAALVAIEATRCRHLIPGYGPVGTCADVAAFAQYFDALDLRVAALLRQGVGLAELHDRCDLPQFARWDQYQTLHPQNANRTYLRLEGSQLE